MQKRKSPVLMGSLLAVMLGGLVIYGLSLPKTDEHGNEQPQRQDQTGLSQVTGSPRQTASKDQIRESSLSGTRGPRRPDEGEDMGQNAEPSILLPETQEYRPQPNTSSVSSHWYNENSQHNKDGK